MKLTIAQLLKIAPLARLRASLFIVPLNEAMDEFDINTPARQNSFLAQVAHESTSFNRLVEGLNYGPAGLLDTFEKYFTAEQAVEYARQPIRIANRVYANRMGNGDEKSGDGWKYRGRGLIQTTGKDNYIAAMMALDIDCVVRPELLEIPENACRSAGLFWKTNGCNQLADAGDQRAVTRRVNGGYHGLAERLAFFESARKVIA